MYKLVLRQEEDVITERIFDSDVYSSKTKLNLKKLFNQSIQELTEVLTEKKLDVNYQKYDLISEYKKQVDYYTKKNKEVKNILKNKSTQFNITMYYDDNIVISRDFKVREYNTASRFSLNLYEVFSSIVESIKYEVKLQDSFYQIEDSVLRNFYKNVNPEVIKEMGSGERESKFNFAYSKIFSVSDPKTHE